MHNVCTQPEIAKNAVTRRARLKGKHIVVIGVDGVKYVAAMEPVVRLLVRYGAHVQRLVRGRQCSETLADVGYRPWHDLRGCPDMFICIDSHEAHDLPLDVPVLAMPHGGSNSLSNNSFFSDPAYLRCCDYFMLACRFQPEDFANKLYISDRHRTHVTIIPHTTPVFSEIEAANAKHPEKDAVLFAIASTHYGDQLSPLFYACLRYVLEQTPYICLFRPSPGCADSPDAQRFINTFSEHERFVLDTGLTLTPSLVRSVTVVNSLTSVGQKFALSTGRPIIEICSSSYPGFPYIGFNVHSLDEFVDAFTRCASGEHGMEASIRKARDLYGVQEHSEEIFITDIEHILRKERQKSWLDVPMQEAPPLPVFASPYEELFFLGKTLLNEKHLLMACLMRNKTYEVFNGNLNFCYEMLGKAFSNDICLFSFTPDEPRQVLSLVPSSPDIPYMVWGAFETLPDHYQAFINSNPNRVLGYFVDATYPVTADTAKCFLKQHLMDMAPPFLLAPLPFGKDRYSLFKLFNELFIAIAKARLTQG